MERIYLTLRWLFGVLFFLVGMASFQNILLKIMSLIAISLLLLIPIRSCFYSESNKSLSTKASVICASVLFLVLFAIHMMLFFRMGIGSVLLGNIFAGMSLIAISMLLLPPVMGFVQSKFNKSLSVKTRAISILVLFIVCIVSVQIGRYQATRPAKEHAKKVAKEKEKNIEYFNENSAQILSDARAALTARDYESTISLTSKYLVSGNEELLAINNEAKSELARIQKVARTEELLAEIKTVPDSDYQKKKGLYQQLATLNPDNANYQSNVDTYEQKIEADQMKQRFAEYRKKKIESQFSVSCPDIS